MRYVAGRESVKGTLLQARASDMKTNLHRRERLQDLLRLRRDGAVVDPSLALCVSTGPRWRDVS